MSEMLRESQELAMRLMELWEGKEIPMLKMDEKKQTICFVYSGKDYQLYINAINEASEKRE